MVYKPSISSAGKANVPRTTKLFTAPAPIGGIDARNILGDGNIRNCIYAYNLVPSEAGVRVRSGYREWQIDIETVPEAGAGVRSIIPFSATADSADRLFAVTNEGIWDVSVSGDAPVLMTDPLEWALTGDDAGWGVYTVYVAGNDVSYIFYADSLNGLFRYDTDTDAWARPADITGVLAESINFVTVHKLRVWFGAKNDATGYYLEPDAIKGAATPFEFGGKFKHGGSLVGLYNWTVDGGIGVDDYLVAVSSAGDVLPYQGSDPALINGWGITGSYYIGQTVRGGRCASQQGGNLHLLSSYGLISMSDLLRGVDPRLPDAQSVSAKIAPFLRNHTVNDVSKHGWAVLNLSSEGSLIVVTPERTNGENIEYVYNISVDGWGLWREIPINCIDTWGSSPYIGTADGRVLCMDVAKDDVKLTPPVDGVNGSNINFSMMFSYTSLGEEGLFKRGMLIRPDFLSKGKVSVEAKFFYDYDVSEILTTPVDAGTIGYVWDASYWDFALWNTSELVTSYTTQGASGMGRTVSAALKGNALADTLMASCDIFYNTGGGL